jgi:hypothetical protein
MPDSVISILTESGTGRNVGTGSFAPICSAGISGLTVEGAAVIATRLVAEMVRRNTAVANGNTAGYSTYEIDNVVPHLDTGSSEPSDDITDEMVNVNDIPDIEAIAGSVD